MGERDRACERGEGRGTNQTTMYVAQAQAHVYHAELLNQIVIIIFV